MGQPEKQTQQTRASSASVQAELELDLVLGRFRPRERLIEDELMARFDAKRHVVRSALAELERVGLVERRPNKGAMVREYSSSEVEEIYAFRADLHRIAVERMALPLAPDVVAQLKDLAARHEAAIEAGDLTEVILCINAFHDTLFDQCGNRFLAESIRHLGATSHAIRSYRVGDPELLRQAAEEHRNIIAAAADGQRDLLADLCDRHIQPSKEMYLRDRTLRVL
jgi:DNA-binding GntR family transcriptional regulator